MDLAQTRSRPSRVSPKCTLSASIHLYIVRVLTRASTAASSGGTIVTRSPQAPHQDRTGAARRCIVKTLRVSIRISVLFFTLGAASRQLPSWGYRQERAV